MLNLNKKYKLIPIKNGDFQIDMPVIEHLPEVKVYVKNNGEYLGIYDGGTTLSSLFMIKNLSSQEAQNKLFEICKTNKVSKDKNVFFVETYEKDFDARLNDFVNALNQIATI